ncbi:hypothetical protein L596_011296 [Steinernema carpocapsae]|uniref:Uncharacterized protein n=1 Tax=Steinernema carpocapsae TaxID=34508 RepID=A0A4U5NTG2_STECR|nr:hypothetical protein L596_011296 [Steinernema carpocapsae]
MRVSLTTILSVADRVRLKSSCACLDWTTATSETDRSFLANEREITPLCLASERRTKILESYEVQLASSTHGLSAANKLCPKVSHHFARSVSHILAVLCERTDLENSNGLRHLKPKAID